MDTVDAASLLPPSSLPPYPCTHTHTHRHTHTQPLTFLLLFSLNLACLLLPSLMCLYTKANTIDYEYTHYTHRGNMCESIQNKQTVHILQ